MVKRKLKVLVMVLGTLFLGGLSMVEAGDNGPDTDIYMTVAEIDPQTRLSVTVPTIFAFAVNGTKDTSSQVAIAVDQNTLLIPNVRVAVTPDGKSTIEVIGSGKFSINNYSTTMAKDVKGEPNYNPAIRQGIPVKLEAYIKNQGTLPERNQWTAISEDDEVTVATENAKKYRITLKAEEMRYPFNQKSIEVGNDTIKMNGTMSLEKPLEAFGYTESGIAKSPSKLPITMGVEVGGVRGNYNTAEKSVKAGKIIWNVSQ